MKNPIIHISDLYDFPLDGPQFYRLENKKGCYLLYDRNKEIIYAGKSSDLYKRVQAHICSSFSNDIKYFRILQIEGSYSYHDLEKYLIIRFSPKYNKQWVPEIKYDLNFKHRLGDLT